jgi:broad specificity phosphatase PhoE
MGGAGDWEKMTMLNRLYLVRHGENMANLTKEFSYRHVDYSLTPKGVLQAQQTAAYFTDKHIHEIYTSPLKRAVETADIIATAITAPVVILEHFREVNAGTLEGQPVRVEHWALYHRIFDDWFAGKADTTFPGGESYGDLWARMHTGLQRVLAKKNGRNIILVGHGGLFTATLQDLCRGISVEWLRRHPNHNGSITEIMTRWQDGAVQGELLSWASCTHLYGEAAEVMPGVPDVAEPLDWQSEEQKPAVDPI